MSKPKSNKGKRPHESVLYENKDLASLMDNLESDSFEVADYIISESLLKNFEFIIMKKEIDRKCKPHSTVSTKCTVSSLVHLSFLGYDYRFDDKILKDERGLDREEPPQVLIDTYHP